jgi:hypothetical protein
MMTNPESGSEFDVMREQLDYLIDQTAEHIGCGCSDCRRYLRVRSILLEIFGEPQKSQIQEFPKLAQAA